MFYDYTFININTKTAYQRNANV